MAQRALYGGPLDGSTIADRRPFVHVSHRGEWFVYRLTGPHGGRYEFMGFDAHLCLGCDAVVEVPRSAACPLCGAPGPYGPAPQRRGDAA